jgi:2-polyprenyl-3-methyl-5-hydroxy-6-metoxy-1,4-benzoquinol methylase
LSSTNLSDIPKGRTQRGVNKAIIDLLQKLHQQGKCKLNKVLDIPCGNGDYLNAFTRLFSPDKAIGGDIRQPDGKLNFEFLPMNATEEFHPLGDQTFDVVTAISGVMEFDNTTGFLRQCHKHLSDNGLLIVTNDNCQTVRDRISYFLTGRLRRFHLILDKQAPTYKHVPIAELAKILEELGMEIIDIKYTSRYPEDLILSPLAVILYGIQFWYLSSHYKHVSIERKKMLFPFDALMCRHYVMVARKV